jgi:hypothetical protein
MKNIIYITLILFSCTKEVKPSVEEMQSARGGGLTRYMVSVKNHDTAYGVRSTFLSESLGGGDQKSKWVGAHIYHFSNKDVWEFAQVGPVTRSGNTSIWAMFFTYKRINNSDTILIFTGFPSGTKSLAPMNIRLREQQSFSIEVRGKLCYIQVDGVDCLEVPIQGDFITTKHLSTEIGQTRKQPNFPITYAYPALEMKTSEGWKLCDHAISSGSGWGVEGINQNSSLRKGEVKIGTNNSLDQVLW